MIELVWSWKAKKKTAFFQNSPKGEGKSMI